MNNDLKIVAVVKFNDGEALILNRPLYFLYEFSGRDLIGGDGPFRYAYRYEAPSSRLKAFAGRKFDIPLKDGGSVAAHGQYWQSHISGTASVTYAAVEQLVKCYVFYGGACVDLEIYAAMRAEYTGCVYPYRDYEKVITFDKERRYWIDRAFKLERDKKSLIKNVKAISSSFRDFRAALRTTEELEGRNDGN
jgi:hypothetical protein